MYSNQSKCEFLEDGLMITFYVLKLISLKLHQSKRNVRIGIKNAKVF